MAISRVRLFISIPCPPRRALVQSGFTLTVTSLAANISRGQCMGSHRTPSQPVEDPLDPLQIGKSHRKRARTTCSVRVPSLARL